MLQFDPRLDAARELLRRWRLFRDYLASLGYSGAVDFMDRCFARIEGQLHTRRWPLVWWRFLSIDAAFSDLSRWIWRADGEGHFFGPASSGYVPERSRILEWADELAEEYQRLSKPCNALRSKS